MWARAQFSGVALLAVASLPGAAAAQAPTHEVVQAFKTYCLGSAADPSRVKAKLRDIYRTTVSGWLTSTAWITKGLVLKNEKDPAREINVHFEEPPGWPRECRVSGRRTSFDWQLVYTDLARELALGVGAVTVLPEQPNRPFFGGGRPELELTTWRTRLDGTAAEIELRVPKGKLEYGGFGSATVKLSVGRRCSWCFWWWRYWWSGTVVERL